MDIAAAAGTTRATVYKYFETKELILKAILEELLNELLLEMDYLPEMKDSFERFREEIKDFIYLLFEKYKGKLKLLYGYNFIYTDENPGPPLRINHLIAGKEALRILALEKKLIRTGIFNSKQKKSVRLQVFMESLLGLAGQLAGKGGILEDIKGISPRTYLDTMIDIFLDSLSAE